MKLHQALVFVAAFSSVTETSFGQSVSAQKTGYQALNPDIFGSVEVRHSVLRAQDGDKVTRDDPTLFVLPTLGLGLFDGQVRTSFTFVYTKEPESMVVNKAAFFNFTSWTAMKGDSWAISPSAYSQFEPDGNSLRFANLGVTFSGMQKLENSLGSILFRGYVDPKVQVVGRRASQTDAFRVTPRNETSLPTLSFDEEGTTSIEQRDPTYADDTGVAFSVSPAFLKDFSTGLGVDVSGQWRPKYVTREADGRLDTDLDGYERRVLSITRWSVGYRLSDRVSLNGFVAHYMGGLYEYPIQNALAFANHELGDNRWETRISLFASLF